MIPLFKVFMSEDVIKTFLTLAGIWISAVHNYTHKKTSPNIGNSLEKKVLFE